MRIDVPRAPGLGLMLDEIHYEKYNKRFANDGIHEALDWQDVEDQVESFKEDLIFQDMIQGEKEHSMFQWLKCLPMHTFTQRHFENSDPTLGDSTLRYVDRLVQRENQDANGANKDEAETCNIDEKDDKVQE